MAVAYLRSDTLTGIRTPLCWTPLREKGADGPKKVEALPGDVAGASFTTAGSCAARPPSPSSGAGKAHQVSMRVTALAEQPCSRTWANRKR